MVEINPSLYQNILPMPYYNNGNPNISTSSQSFPTAGNANAYSTGGSNPFSKDLTALNNFGGALNAQDPTASGSNTASPNTTFNPGSSIPNITPQAELVQQTVGAPPAIADVTQTPNIGPFPNGNAPIQQQQPQQQVQGATNGGIATPSQQTGLSSDLFSNVVSKLGSNLFGGVTNAINDFGAGLGFGSGGLAAIPSGLSAAETSFLATAQASSGASMSGVAGSLGTTASLSSVLGGAGFGGFVGGVLSKFTGGSQIGSSLGGALGGAIGAATGISSGIAMGATLGSIVPGLGTVIGAIGGSLLGGLFGGKKGTSAGMFGSTLSPTGSLSSTSFSQKNGTLDFAKAESSQFSDIAQRANQDLGINFTKDLYIGGGYNTLHSQGPTPYFLDVGGHLQNRVWFDPKDNKSTADAFYSGLLKAASMSGYTDTTSLYNWFYQTGPYNDPNQKFNSTGWDPTSGTFAPITIAPRVG